ncbi:MAG TPA: VOC family protein [Baekduia sp.]|uniref:VOC family protein n=1 Tax=Baekduia sp. TaxID=2600305 RepID=UPI002D78F069|nr:VOC family protein [Baekduia sp.]HET6507037.1 VOC family protein [Baekduia sp.]
MPRVTGMFHAGVTVSDMETALRFYRDGLGLEVVLDGESTPGSARRIWQIAPEHVRVVFLRVPGSDTMVELFEFMGIERHPASARPCDYGAGHFCVFVDDAEAILARIKELGFRSRADEVVEITAGPHAGAKVVYLIDPDGYHVELYEQPAGVADVRTRLG